MNDLSHAFLGMDPEEHRIKRVLMVGAVPEKGNMLSLNDRSLLRETVRVLEAFKIPLSHDLAKAVDIFHPASSDTVRVINIQSEYGGEDFLQSREKGDLVILCNIKKDVDAEYKVDRETYRHDSHPSLRKAYLSSAAHDDTSRWTSKILDTGAKFAFIYGCDNFDTADLNKGQFVTINTPNIPKGVLINRSYFELAEGFIAETGGALQVLIPAADDPKRTFFYDTFGHNPQDHKIRPERAFA